MLSITDNPQLAMLVLIVFFFLLGTFLEPVPALIIVVPIMGPLIAHLGYDPVHFGIVTIMLLVVGSVTPPVGRAGDGGLPHRRGSATTPRLACWLPSSRPGWWSSCWSPTSRIWSCGCRA